MKHTEFFDTMRPGYRVRNPCPFTNVTLALSIEIARETIQQAMGKLALAYRNYVVLA